MPYYLHDSIRKSNTFIFYTFISLWIYQGKGIGGFKITEIEKENQIWYFVLFVLEFYINISVFEVIWVTRVIHSLNMLY
jgi:hypothetical protein